MDAFSNIRSNGLIAINLKENDELVDVLETSGDDTMIIGTHDGYSVTFKEEAVRDMGRTASGVRGIRLRENDYVVGVSVITPDKEVLVITENGYGKRTAGLEYPVKGRGGKGIKTANITAKNGPLAGLTTVNGNEDIMLVTNKGVIIRFNVASVSQTGRATLGVRLMKLEDDAKVVTMAAVEAEAEVEETEVTPATTEANDTTETTEIETILELDVDEENKE